MAAHREGSGLHKEPDGAGDRARSVRRLDRPAAPRYQWAAARFRVRETRGGATALSGPGVDLRTRTSDHYRITIGDGRSTEELVAAGDYGYAHSCVTSEYFPARPGPGVRTRDIILLEFDADVTADD